MPSSTVPSDPPMVDLKVTNPVTYLKLWWKKVIANEGMDIRVRIHPLTTILIAFLLLGGTYTLGFLTSAARQIPFLGQIINTPLPTSVPAIIDWKDTALTGKLQLTPNTNKYYLVTTSATAVSLEFPSQVDLTKYIGKRILASGSYNSKTHILIISDILDLEVIPSSPIPLVTPNSTATPSLPTPLASSEPTATPTSP